MVAADAEQAVARPLPPVLGAGRHSSPGPLGPGISGDRRWKKGDRFMRSPDSVNRRRGQVDPPYNTMRNINILVFGLLLATVWTAAPSRTPLLAQHETASDLL